MRKFYCLILFISLQAQCQFFEGFEGSAFPPAGWIISDNGVGMSSWKSNSGTAIGAFEGEKSAFSNPENIGAGNTSEDWLISPLITVQQNKTLTFYSKQTITGDQKAFFQIRISTTSQTDHNSFVAIAGWSENYISQGTDFQKKIVSLADYGGQNVYIAFVKIFYQDTPNTVEDKWILDNVTVNDLNTIIGSASFTAGASCGVGAVPKGGVKLIVENELGTHNVFTDSDGNYSFTGFQNNATISADVYNSGYFHVTPSSYSFNFTTAGNVGIANFCIKPQGLHPDLEVVMLPNFIKPGFDNHYTYVYRNTGNQTLSGSVSVNYDEYRMHIFGGYPQPYALSAPNTVTWNFTDLKPLETRIQEIGFSINASTDLNYPVNEGDNLTFTVTILPISGDETPENNVFTLVKQATLQEPGTPSQANDIMVSEGSFITLQQAGDFLHYTIRFQNTGATTVHKVVIRNILEDDLDATTVEIIGASHPFKPVLDSKTLEFSFENIDLSPTSVNEEDSFGYVTYKVKPASNIGIGSVMENNAEIYFDSNFPIATNSVTTTVTNNLGNIDFSKETALHVYPNPAKNVLNIKTNHFEITSITVFNNVGQTVFSAAGNPQTIDISNFSSGIYILQANGDKAKLIQKFIKL